MADIHRELEALNEIIDKAARLAEEAMDRKADIEQAKVALGAMGRGNQALRIALGFRLNRARIIESDAKIIEGETVGRARRIEAKSSNGSRRSRPAHKKCVECGQKLIGPNGRQQ